MPFTQEQQQPYQEHEVDRMFQDLGLPAGGTGDRIATTGGYGTDFGTSGFGTGYDLPTGAGQMVPYPFRGMTEGDPKYMEKETSGFFDQFKEGLLSPVTDTMSMLGAREPRDMPTSLGGIIGNIAGSVVGWSAVGLVTKGVGLAPLAAKLGTGAAAVGSKAIPAATRGLIGAGTAGTMGKGMLYGGLSQAHWAAGQQMPLEEIPKESLIGAAFGGVMGGAMGAVGQRLQKQRTTATDIVKSMQSKAPGRSEHTIGRHAANMIHIDDPHSMAEAHRTLGALKKARNVTDLVSDQVMQKQHPSPGTRFLNDTGTNVYHNQFNYLDEFDQVGLLRNAVKKSSMDESMLSGWLKPGTSNTKAGRGLMSWMRGLRGRDGRIFRGIVDASEVKPTKVEKPRNLGAKANELFDSFGKAKTFQEKYRQATRMQGRIRNDINQIKGNRPFRQLEYEEMSDIAGYERTIQDMWWEMDNHVDSVLRLNPDTPVPSLNKVKSPKLAKVLQEELSEMEVLPDHVIYHQDADEFLRGINRQTGQSFKPNLDSYQPSWKSVRDSSFLPDDLSIEWRGQQRMAREVWEEIANQIPEGEMIGFAGPQAALALPDRIPQADLKKWLKKVVDMPDSPFTELISWEEHLRLQEPVGVFQRFLSPARKLLGEKNMRVLRDASVKKRQFEGGWLEKVKAIGDTIGARSEVDRRRLGAQLTGVREGTNRNASRMNRNIQDNVEYMMHRRGEFIPDEISFDDTAIDFVNRQAWEVYPTEEAARSLDIPQRDLNDILNRVHTVANTPQIKEEIKRTAIRTGRTSDDIIADMMYNRIRDHKLVDVVEAGGERLTREARDLWDTSPEMLRGSKMAKDMFDELFTHTNLDQDMYRAAYLPHFKRSADLGAHRSSRRALDADWDSIGVPEEVRSDIFWMNEMTREDILADYNPNFFELAERYVRGLSKKKHFEPAMKQVDSYLEQVKPDESRANMWGSMKEYLKGTPGDFEKQTDQMIAGVGKFLGKHHPGKHPRPTAEIGGLLAELQYSAGMGYNPWMPVRNLTQKLLGAASITDSGNPLEGLYWIGKAKHQKATGKGWARYLNQHNPILHDRIAAEGLNLEATAVQRYMQGKGFKDSAAHRVKKLQDHSMKMFRWSDRSNVEDVFNAKALYLMEQKGAPWADAIELARGTTMATQFMYGIDSPMLYKTPAGKQLGIYQSWPLNWAHMMAEQGTKGQYQQAAATIVTMAVASEILSQTGISLRSIHPVETARGILPYALMEGDMQYPAALRTASAGLDYMRNLAEGDEEAVDQALQNFKMGAEGLVPFGVVTSRTLRTIDRVRHDWKDFEDPGFMNLRALSPQTREDTSRLRHDIGPVEGTLGALATTTRAHQRQDDWKFVSEQMVDYRRMRGEAIEHFISGDMDKFMDKQERLVLNFGQWIEPQDIHREMDLMDKSARERQLRGFPEEARAPYLEMLEERYKRGY